MGYYTDIGEYCPSLGYRRTLATFNIPTRDNIHQYQCNKPILLLVVVFFLGKAVNLLPITPPIFDNYFQGVFDFYSALLSWLMARFLSFFIFRC